MAKKQRTFDPWYLVGGLVGAGVGYAAYRAWQSRSRSVSWEVPETDLTGVPITTLEDPGWTHAEATYPAPSTTPLPSDVRAAQTILRSIDARRYALGPSGVDGRLGRYTTAALRRFQQDNDDLPTGLLDSATIAALRTAYFARRGGDATYRDPFAG